MPSQTINQVWALKRRIFNIESLKQFISHVLFIKELLEDDL